MAYYLKHFFDPDFNHQRLKPRESADGRVDHYNLGYVQNVAKGQVLAQWVDSVEQAGGNGNQLAYEDRVFPAGKNTLVDPEDSSRLLAAVPGYVFYQEGLINVKRTLNVPRDVDFHTGNIKFSGNVIIHGGVRSGFQVQGLNIMIKDTVEAALIRADESIVAEAGIKGGGKGVVKASGNLRASYAENAMLLAGGRTLIDVACMHCEVFSGEQLAVKGRLAGGMAVSSRLIFVGEQLGGALGTETTLILGYDAMLLNKSQLVEARIKVSKDRLKEREALLAKHKDLGDELMAGIVAERERLETLLRQHRKIWSRISSLEDVDACRVVVPGKVLPGVEVCIGEACLTVNEYLEDVCFTYKDYEIVITSPAMKR
ncbi:MAG: FapA family protein [Proteobacteria bacterium]|nr:FapA family protein [Pseudomonadota bacterium]